LFLLLESIISTRGIFILLLQQEKLTLLRKLKFIYSLDSLESVRVGKNYDNLR